MRYVEGENRTQAILFPECLEDYIDENNSVRVIDAFVECLNLNELGYQRVVPAKTGRPPYNPRHLLKLYLYGYMNRIRSSRRLEKESSRNLEVMWLLGKLSPDFKTISDFRKENKQALKNTFCQFVLICKGWGLYEGQLIAIDSSKFKAVNAKKKNYNQDKLTKKIKEIEEKIESYLEEMDAIDEQELPEKEKTSEEIKKMIDELKNRKVKYQGYETTMKETGETQISATDPDARSMPSNQKIEVCYNVQTTVEEKHKLILDFEATNEIKDHGQLSIMSKRAKKILGVESIEVLADKGYHKALDLKECIDHHINPYVPKPNNPNAPEEKEFDTGRFQYDSEKDLYTCPGKKELVFRHTYHKDSKTFKRYNNYEACKECNLRQKCTKSIKNGRNVDRWEHQEILEQIEAQTSGNWEKYRKRQWLSEHPFGTIKRGFDASYLLTKGKQSVNAEISLSFLIYNLRRVINIIGTKEIIHRLAEV